MRFLTLLALTLFFFVTQTACIKTDDRPQLDFSGSEVYTVHELLQHCSIDKCSDEGYWEGQTIRVRGSIAEGSITPGRFFLLDEETGSWGIAVNITGDTTAIQQMLSPELDVAGQWRIEGVGVGMDLPSNTSCIRVIAIDLDSAANLTRE